MDIAQAKEGMKVLCVNGNIDRQALPPALKNRAQLPIKGQIYTVDRIVTPEGGPCGLTLRELTEHNRILVDWSAPPGQGFEEPCFSPHRFEPAAP